MSPTQQETTTAFTPVTVDSFIDPELILDSVAACGLITELSDPKTTSSETYERCTFKITGTRGSSNFYGSFMFQPEWFTPGFEKSSLPDSSTKFVHQMNVGLKGKSQNGLLYAILESAGETPEAGIAAWKTLIASKINEVKRYVLTPDEIISLLRQFIAQNNVELAYVKKQKREKTGGTTKDGKPEYKGEDGYEVAYYTTVSSEWAKQCVKMAEKVPEAGKAGLLLGFNRDLLGV